MISALLLILKIFLYLLLILIILAAFILLAPFKYRIKGSYYESRLKYNVHCIWLLNIVSFCAYKNDKNDIYFRFLWKKYGNNNEKESSVNSKDENIDSNSGTSISQQDNKTSNVTDNIHDDYSDELEEIEKKNENDSLKSKDSDEKGDEKENSLMAKFSYIYNYPDKKILYGECKLLLKRTLRALKPKYMKIKISFGLNSPDVVGMLTGLGGVIRSLFYNKNYIVNINGDFEKEAIEGDVDIRGGVTALSLLWPLVFFALSKPVWRIIKNKYFNKKKKN
ncbi:MAG: hypothetical protein LBU94_01935, partial [Clostridiales bacterium]|nr:hypothetical protein [Clostridiales bacterium]